MFVLIWMTLLIPVYSDAPVERKQHCDSGYCVTLPVGEIRAEAGLCVEIPCSFLFPSAFVPKHVVWYKCEPTNENCAESDMIFDSENVTVAPEFKGRVSLGDMRFKLCTITINDLKESDSGSYQVRLNGVLIYDKYGHTFSPKATLAVKALSQKPRITMLVEEGEETTLTCTAPGLCSGPDPRFSWRWSRDGEEVDVPDQSIKYLGRTSTLTFMPSAEQHGAEVTCKASFTGDIATEETVLPNMKPTCTVVSQPGSSAAAAWAIAGVSLCVNVLCFILIFFLWNARKKMKSNQEVRMYKSPGDDGSAQPLQ